MEVVDLSGKTPEQLAELERRVLDMLRAVDANVMDAMKVGAAVLAGAAMIGQSNMGLAELGAQMMLAQIFQVARLQSEDDCGHEECRLAREEEIRRLNEG